MGAYSISKQIPLRQYLDICLSACMSMPIMLLLFFFFVLCLPDQTKSCRRSCRDDISEPQPEPDQESTREQELNRTRRIKTWENIDLYLTICVCTPCDCAKLLLCLRRIFEIF